MHKKQFLPYPDNGRKGQEPLYNCHYFFSGVQKRRFSARGIT